MALTLPPVSATPKVGVILNPTVKTSALSVMPTIQMFVLYIYLQWAVNLNCDMIVDLLWYRYHEPKWCTIFALFDMQFAET